MQLNEDDLEQEELSVKITMDDFAAALTELNPAYTQHRAKTEATYFPYGYLSLTSTHEEVHDVCMQVIEQARRHSSSRRLLIYGPAGTGKTTVAIHAAMLSNPDYLKVLRAGDLFGLGESLKLQRIATTFQEATAAENAVIILDGIDRIAEIVTTSHLQGSYSHPVVHTLLTSLSSVLPSSGVVVIATTQQDPRETSFTTNVLQISQMFDTSLRLPLLGGQDIRRVAQEFDCDLSDIRFPHSLRLTIRLQNEESTATKAEGYKEEARHVLWFCINPSCCPQFPPLNSGF
eukprot:m.193490 g.193490  ORF g.193490 m.193490 type:complete len:289 (+) comp16782_c3_seq6:218-1084(+)